MADDKKISKPTSITLTKRTKRQKLPIDFDPVVPKVVNESLDQLIQDGLGSTKELTAYKKALSNPEDAVKSAVYRDYVAKALDRLLDIIEDDQTIYNRVRMALQKQKLKEEAQISIIERAVARRQTRSDK